MTNRSVIYNDTMPTAIADRLFYSNPLAVTRLVSKSKGDAEAVKEPERFDALERAGFKVTRYGDIVSHVHERFGGHYIDMGSCAKIANGLVRWVPFNQFGICD